MPKKKLKPPPRFQLAMTPTPLEAFGLSPDPNSEVDIFIKRDDMTGSEVSGNKIRKLEFLLYDAIAQKSDILLTCGGVGSNHCRATAAMAARIGIDCEMTLMGKAPAVPDGNLLLDTLFGAKIKYVSVAEYERDIQGVLLKRAKVLQKRGRKPYIIPEGASNPLGLWGYFLAGIELKKQIDKAGIKATHIACAVGSGGTYGGLMLAAMNLSWDVEIIGYAVNRNREYFKNRIVSLIERFLEKYQLELKFNPELININDSYIGKGYAKIGPKEVSFIQTIAANSGILVDPAYTGKALIGLFDNIRSGVIAPKSNVVFLHTGGLLSIFPYRRQLART